MQQVSAYELALQALGTKLQRSRAIAAAQVGQGHAVAPAGTRQQFTGAAVARRFVKALGQVGGIAWAVGGDFPAQLQQGGVAAVFQLDGQRAVGGAALRVVAQAQFEMGEVALVASFLPARPWKPAVPWSDSGSAGSAR